MHEAATSVVAAGPADAVFLLSIHAGSVSDPRNDELAVRTEEAALAACTSPSPSPSPYRTEARAEARAPAGWSSSSQLLIGSYYDEQVLEGDVSLAAGLAVSGEPVCPGGVDGGVEGVDMSPSPSPSSCSVSPVVRTSHFPGWRRSEGVVCLLRSRRLDRSDLKRTVGDTPLFCSSSSIAALGFYLGGVGCMSLCGGWL